MKQHLFTTFLKILEKFTGKKIVYFPKNRAVSALTAVKADFGFWYAGNVLDMSDIAYGVLYNGMVEEEGSYLVVNSLKHLLLKKERLIFYDIGANTGYFGVLAAFLGLPNKIFTYAFEPVMEFNRVQAETLKLNGLENSCRIFNFALGEKDAQAEVFLAGSGTSLRRDFVGNRQLETRTISVRKLDNVVREKNLETADFIKIDVEGHELSVLKGAEDLIKKSLPIIWYESALTIKATGYVSKDFFETQDFLKSLGYEVFLCGPKISQIVKTSVADGVAMYLALHKDAHKDLIIKIPKLYAKS